MEKKYRLLNRLAYFRELHELTQQELSNIVGVRRETIVNLEKGKYNPSLKLALAIAREFGAPVENVFWLSDDENH